MHRPQLDTSVPAYHGSLSPLDKTAFRKTVPVLALRVPAAQTGSIIKHLVGIPKIKPVVADPSAPEDNSRRLVLLGVNQEADIPPDALDFFKMKGNGFIKYDLLLEYDHWTASEILQAILPENLREGAPNGFSATGHIAHMNLNDEYLPYKRVIGEIFLDVRSGQLIFLIVGYSCPFAQQKNKSIKTVVNKLDNIDTQFRFFDMEILAGERNFVVEHHESDCRFTFDFSQVYWNSRLHTEHERIVSMLTPGEVLADVFAGVGPFALPAAKKGCAVLANDLNPNSFKYLSKNVEDNDVADSVRTSCEDGRDFIRNVFAKVAESPFPPFLGLKASKTKARKLEKEAKKTGTSLPSARTSTPFKPPRITIDHFVMNLPDTAILFLDAFRGVLAPESLREIYHKMPMIHCHCFTRELEQDKAEEDIRKRVEEKLGHPITEEVSVILVRSVAPGKDMYCSSTDAQACSGSVAPTAGDAGICGKAPLGTTARGVSRHGHQYPSRSPSVTRSTLSGFLGPHSVMVSPSLLPTVHCDSTSTTSNVAAAISTVRSAVKVPETELKRWRRLFDANAKVIEGEKYLDQDSFVNAIAPSGDLSKIGRAQFGILFRVADTSKRGLVSWEDFTVFETVLKRPDADYWIAFQYFDVDSSGYISYDEFKNVFSANIGPDAIPFDFECDWVKLYLGKKNGTHVLGYNEFTQLMKGLQGERLRQAFRFLDEDQDGFIRPEQFKRIILEIAGHKLSDAIIDRLPTLCTLTPGQRISYSEVIAFHNVVREMDMVERIIREATNKSKDGRISQSDFLDYAASSSRYSLFTPMEASIIFHFAGRGNGSQRLALIDFAQLLDPRWSAPSEAEEVTLAPKTSFLNSLMRSTYGFVQGGFAGAFGATIVYPIDMGKRRVSSKNQRSTVVGQRLYSNSIDCARKILLNEGFLGFYRGLGPQLIGVAPEKAIKLTVNDLIRSRMMDPETGRIKLGWEFVAGGTAGGCQVVQGEAAKAEGAMPRGAIHIVRQLGVVGLYKGASACLLRDIPFSAIYFPAYGHLKSDLFKEGYNGKQLSFLETLAAAGIAGMPAAYLTTPADVVKTRLQVEARKGETHYKGLRDAFVKIYREEGFPALFKGGPARVLRSSPQFGFTLLAYEELKKLYPWDEKPRKIETALTSRPKDEMSRIRARNALKILLDVHGDFGRRAAAAGDLSLASPKLYDRSK
ncbi:mitochondrial aspartate-glutamate transporter agc1 [Marasmius crinis-equi]|uniref:tRNA (guanine(37)-N1)-methyltransferase n=1 Tax=Marasmius crinis-equi TaxID=585013 RepID=A0ABR3FN64_9AGAR